jgi:hypothetical protein
MENETEGVRPGPSRMERIFQPGYAANFDPYHNQIPNLK